MSSPPLPQSRLGHNPVHDQRLALSLECGWLQLIACDELRHQTLVSVCIRQAVHFKGCVSATVVVARVTPVSHSAFRRPILKKCSFNKIKIHFSPQHSIFRFLINMTCRFLCLWKFLFSVVESPRCKIIAVSGLEELENEEVGLYNRGKK